MFKFFNFLLTSSTMRVRLAGLPLECDPAAIFPPVPGSSGGWMRNDAGSRSGFVHFLTSMLREVCPMRLDRAFQSVREARQRFRPIVFRLEDRLVPGETMGASMPWAMGMGLWAQDSTPAASV